MSMKRGRLRSITTSHMYDENNAPAGHTVRAEFEPPEPDGDEGSVSGPQMGMGSSPMPAYQSNSIETPHETYDSAEAKAREHHTENLKRFGHGKPKGFMSHAKMRAAAGRKV